MRLRKIFLFSTLFFAFVFSKVEASDEELPADLGIFLNQDYEIATRAKSFKNLATFIWIHILEVEISQNTWDAILTTACDEIFWGRGEDSATEFPKYGAYLQAFLEDFGSFGTQTYRDFLDARMRFFARRGQGHNYFRAARLFNRVSRNVEPTVDLALSFEGSKNEFMRLGSTLALVDLSQRRSASLSLIYRKKVSDRLLRDWEEHIGRPVDLVLSLADLDVYFESLKKERFDSVVQTIQLAMDSEYDFTWHKSKRALEFFERAIEMASMKGVPLERVARLELTRRSLALLLEGYAAPPEGGVSVQLISKGTIEALEYPNIRGECAGIAYVNRALVSHLHFSFKVPRDTNDQIYDKIRSAVEDETPQEIYGYASLAQFLQLMFLRNKDPQNPLLRAYSHFQRFQLFQVRNHDFIWPTVKAKQQWVNANQFRDFSKNFKRLIDAGLPPMLAYKTTVGDHIITIYGYSQGPGDEWPTTFMALDPNLPQHLHSLVFEKDVTNPDRYFYTYSGPGERMLSLEFERGNPGMIRNYQGTLTKVQIASPTASRLLLADAKIPLPMPN